MKKRIKLFVSVILFTLALALFLFSLYQGRTLEKKQIATTLNVSEKSGFDLNKTMLTFGNIVPGTSSTRDIELKNEKKYPIIAEIKIQGNIKKYLEYEDSFRIEPNQTKKVNFKAKIPESESYGDYSGKIIVLIKKA